MSSATRQHFTAKHSDAEICSVQAMCLNNQMAMQGNAEFDGIVVEVKAGIVQRRIRRTTYSKAKPIEGPWNVLQIKGEILGAEGG